MAYPVLAGPPLSAPRGACQSACAYYSSALNPQHKTSGALSTKTVNCPLERSTSSARPRHSSHDHTDRGIATILQCIVSWRLSARSSHRKCSSLLWHDMLMLCPCAMVPNLFTRLPEPAYTHIIDRTQRCNGGLSAEWLPRHGRGTE